MILFIIFTYKYTIVIIIIKENIVGGQLYDEF